MNHLLQGVLETPPATWIAIGALVVSTAALVISAGRFSFDTRLAGAKKATEIRRVLLDMRRTVVEMKQMQDRLPKISPTVEQHLTACAKTLGKLIEDIETVLKQKDLVTLTKDTAIELEKSTADVEDSSKRLAAIAAEFRKGLEPFLPKTAQATNSKTQPPLSAVPKQTQTDTTNPPPPALKDGKPC